MQDQEYKQDIEALERFVVENEPLLELEERIGRFNIFDALGIVRAEVRHSNFLAWLLDPNESHGHGALFLRAVLMDLLRQSEPDLRLLSPIELDGAELRGVRVRREYRNIDILIECEEPKFVIAIENKIDSSEHSGQLERYKNAIRDEYGDVRSQFVFLTREGDEPSDEDWTTYSYRDIHHTLRRVRNANIGSIGDDVTTFLDHYLGLIGSRMMDDPTIDELCRTIYKNHRRAIDLIIEKTGSESPGYQDIKSLIENDERFEIVKTTGRMIAFVLKDWVAMGLPLRRDKKHEMAKHWITIKVIWETRLCFLEIVLGPADDTALRMNIVRMLMMHEDALGFGLSGKKVTKQWTRLRKAVTLDKWGTSGEPDSEKLLSMYKQHIEAWYPGLQQVPKALKHIQQG